MKKINFNIGVFLIASLLLISPLAQARSAPLYDPDPISVPAGKSLEQVKKAINNALVNRKWEPTQISPNHIVGTLHARKHSAIIDINYDTKAVKINYKSSDELNYDIKDGKPFIHPNYNGWIKNLEKDIHFNLLEM